jgi:hypothetical protein
MATLRSEPVDRPAVSFYEIGGFKVDPSDPDEFNVYNSPDWQPLLKLAEEKTDIIRLCSPVKKRSHETQANFSKSNNKNNLIKVKEFIKDGSKFTQTTISIAGRELSSLTRRDHDIDTVWTIEHFIKSTDDLKAYLQIPDDFLAQHVDTDILIKEEEATGNKGIVMVDTGDPICAAGSLFSMEDFLVVALTEQKLLHKLLEKVAGPIYAKTEKTAKEFPGRLWRIYGPEFVTEPFLPPHLFEEYAVPYTSVMVNSIKKYGGFARIHCHGRIRSVLDYIVKMGADAIDPIEPPPQGDVELSYVREKYGRQLVLFGNIEVADIENKKPDEFEKVAKKSLEEGTSGTGRGFVLMPSAAPYGRKISPNVITNYKTMVRLAEEFC